MGTFDDPLGYPDETRCPACNEPARPGTSCEHCGTPIADASTRKLFRVAACLGPIGVCVLIVGGGVGLGLLQERQRRADVQRMSDLPLPVAPEGPDPAMPRGPWVRVRLANGDTLEGELLTPAGANPLEVADEKVGPVRFEAPTVSRLERVEPRRDPPTQWVRSLQTKAQEGDPQAMVLLGIALEDGQGVGADARAAFTWYQKSAQAGHPLGMSRLAWAHNLGIGTRLDHGAFVSWNRKAADKGDPFAKARSHAYGLVPGGKGFRDAYPQYLKAANAGDLRGHYFVAKYLQAGRGVAKDLVSGTDWYRRGALKGSPGCMHWYGVSLKRGWGVRGDPATAIKWYRRAAARNYFGGLHALALEYIEGKVVGANPKLALSLLRRAAATGQQGCEYSMHSLGVVYSKGQGVPKDPAKAVVWFTAAARWGHAPSYTALGEHYQKGLGVPKNPARAAHYFKLAKNAQGN